MSSPKNFEYSFFSKAFHRIVLTSNDLQKSLFSLERFLFLKIKNIKKNTQSLFITGLARSGSTILLNSLYNTGNFASLKYSDMPFIVCPNIWSKISSINIKKNLKKKTRAHDDGIEFDLQSPEAFEEIFWRSQLDLKLNEKDIYEQKDIENEIIKNFENFLQLVTIKEKKNIYLSKNNNNILRLDTLKDKLSNKKIIILFRNPLYHSYSLLKQHNNFCNIQKINPFVLEYMNLLSHNEFGINHKPLFFSEFKSNYENNNINYWLDYWIFIYSKLSKYINNKNDFIFLSFESMKLNPVKILKKIVNNFDIKFELNNIQIFNKDEPRIDLEIDNEKLKIAKNLYKFLINSEIKP